jgi:hypothetical protein
MKKVFYKIIIIALFFGLAFLLVPPPKTEIQGAGEQCKFLPLGQIPERVLEIHKELIWLLTRIEKNYAKMLDTVPAMIELINKCSIEKCQARLQNCPNLCSPDECALERECEAPPNNEDLCPAEVRKDLKELFARIEKYYQDIGEAKNTIILLATPVIGELSLLRTNLNNAKQKLREFNPENQLLFNCAETVSLGWAESCFAQQLKVLGATIPLPRIIAPFVKQPNSALDYFICDLRR